MTSDNAILKEQAQADRDVFMTAVAMWIQEKRASGHSVNVFPKVLYLNKRAWEDHFAPILAGMCHEMKIKVRTSHNLPVDTFHLTDQEYPVADVVSYVKDYGHLPAKA